jgi:hypothetical protein
MTDSAAVQFWEIIADLPDELPVEVARGEDNLQILRARGMGALLVVPLLARGDVLGAITYVSPRGGRTHGGWHGSGPVDRAQAGTAPRRRHHTPEHTRRGEHLHTPPAPTRSESPVEPQEECIHWCAQRTPGIDTDP